MGSALFCFSFQQRNGWVRRYTGSRHHNMSSRGQAVSKFSSSHRPLTMNQQHEVLQPQTVTGNQRKNAEPVPLVSPPPCSQHRVLHSPNPDPQTHRYCFTAVSSNQGIYQCFGCWEEGHVTGALESPSIVVSLPPKIGRAHV